jgi:hypothetical protein
LGLNGKAGVYDHLAPDRFDHPMLELTH